MMKLTLLAAFLVVLISCNSGNNDIAGTYTRSFQKEQKRIEGKSLGMYSVKDSITITEKDNGFLIRNNYWRKNDYDKNGWRKIGGHEHVYTYSAIYDKKLNALVAEMNIYPPLYFDGEQSIIYFEKEGNRIWKKIK